jgi:phytoene desaturase
MAKTAIVIGSGIAGIAAAIRLAKRGYTVSVFEANNYPGGKLSEIRLGAYRFDAGPSLFTLPALVDELFELCGMNPADSFVYEQLDETCRYFFPDGTKLTAWADREKLKQEFLEKLNEPKENVEAALNQSQWLYSQLAPLFIEKSLHKPGTWLSTKAFAAYSRLHKFDFNRTMHEANSKRFENEKTTQLFNRYATYNGSDPYQTPATLNIIPHLEFGIGAYFPKGGMHSITQTLYELAEKVGVRFYFNTTVQKIVVHNGTAKGIDTHMGFHKADRIVCNMDMVAAYRTLLKDQHQPKKLLNQPKSSSALIFYWGIKKSFPQLGLHNIFFTSDYKREFEHIFDKGSLFKDPTVYVNITSVMNPSDAPSGCQNWFTMINVPNNQGQDWDYLIQYARKAIINKLSENLGTNIESFIEEESVLDPRLIELKTSSVAGALYGNSSNNKFAAFLRHPNFSSKIRHLYFCGGSVHPGGGIPLCLSSAKLVDELMNQ